MVNERSNKWLLKINEVGTSEKVLKTHQVKKNSGLEQAKVDRLKCQKDSPKLAKIAKNSEKSARNGRFFDSTSVKIVEKMAKNA